ncbi:hypothetical protein ElyMa_005563900 [Elysia marginata]|uniref:Uncharacterized protein n=1 Tax=Elysia marginata TaxID=1093978 RepID=A0AAV4F0Z9_9GAST|nr:hypothetical protein ElyMa_005563900 [Elysia marginata]
MISAQWSLVDISAQLWTLCPGLVFILIFSIIIGRKSRSIGYVCSGWFSKRVKTPDRASLAHKEDLPRSIQKQLDPFHKEQKSDAEVRNHISDEMSQCMQQSQLAGFFTTPEEYERASEVTPNPEFACSVKNMDNETYPNSIEMDIFLPNKNANFSSDTQPLLDSNQLVDQHFFRETCMRNSETATCSPRGIKDNHKYASSYLGSLSQLETPVDVKTDLRLQEESDSILSNLSSVISDVSKSVAEITVSSSATTGDFDHCLFPGSELSHTIMTKKNETTQTCRMSSCVALFLSKGTMTDPLFSDSSVSTHGKPCRLVRHHSTSTSGPFMKKLRRAHRLLVEARKTSRCDQASSTVKWRKVLNRYKHKMQHLTSHLAKRDEMMGGTSSRITVLRGEIKDALLAVRSTKERLTTQCKLNSALMDVIESKSDNPTYGTDLYPLESNGLKQEQRGP